MNLTRLWPLAACILALGCAKFPDSGAAASTTVLRFTWQLESPIVTGFEPGGAGLPYIYIIALNMSTENPPTDLGPIPVTADGGNGFVAGDATHFILWDPIRSPQFSIWQFQDENLIESVETGVPIQFNQVQTGDTQFEVEVDMAQLVGELGVEDIKAVQVNFLSMNRLALGGTGRVWDALGDRGVGQINTPFTLQPIFNFKYTNQNQVDVEPQGDAEDPGVDIIDWSIEVQIS
jgi:hypothetical protein